MQINNIQNYNYNQRPAFCSTIVPNKTVEDILDRACDETSKDTKGLGEEHKNLLVCLDSIIRDGRNDKIEIGTDENGFAYLKINDREYGRLNGLSNYHYYRLKDNKFEDKFDASGSYEQIFDFAQREKGAVLPYKRHEKSTVVLKDDMKFVYPELNKFRALTPYCDNFFVMAQNLMYQMKSKIRSNLIKELKNIKSEIFVQDLNLMNQNKIELEGLYQNLAEYGEQLDEALSGNPTVRRFFNSYSSRILLDSEQIELPNGQSGIKTRMKITYKHPLHLVRAHQKDASGEFGIVEFSADGQTLEESFDNLISDITTNYELENTNPLSNKLNKEHEKIQKEVQEFEAAMALMQAERLQELYNKYSKIKGE